MTLNPQHIYAALSTVEQELSNSKTLPAIDYIQSLPLYLYDTVTSTNQTLWELLEAGTTPPIAVIATQQTSGRGQWGRNWQSTLGGLYLSVALVPNLPTSYSTQLTLCSAWGIATALRAYHLPVLLKWPNDLLLDGGKLGGILTETRVQQGQIVRAVIGVGINWSNDVPELGITLQSFYRQHKLVKTVTCLDQLAAIVLRGLLSGYHRWQHEGMDRLLPSYLELLSSRGCQVSVEGNLGVVTGITPSGELKVRLISTDTASEIYLPPGTISLGYSPSH